MFVGKTKCERMPWIQPFIFLTVGDAQAERLVSTPPHCQIKVQRADSLAKASLLVLERMFLSRSPFLFF